MKFISSRRRVVVLVGAIGTTAALFTPSAVAKSDVEDVIQCSALGGEGTVTVFKNGVAKGHCSFKENGFPNFGLEFDHAEHVPCAVLAPLVGIQLKPETTPTGQATLTPSRIANVNCRNVFPL